MPATKSLQSVVDKWRRVTPGRTEDFIQGVKNPKTDWSQATSDAEDRYKAGVTKAAAAGSFAKGVNKAGSKKWQEKTLAKGQNRWAEGIAIADSDYAAGMSEVLATIERTDIGPRYAKGDPRNIDRVKKIAMALHAAKMK